MTQPQDPRKHPLQDDEVALARVLRALPSGEPPASVDDAILRAATDAVSPSPRKPAGGLRWLPTWAIGTAAAGAAFVALGYVQGFWMILTALFFAGVGSAGTERITPPAIRKPKAWIG